VQVKDAARELASRYQPFSRYTEDALEEALRPLVTWKFRAEPAGLDVGAGTGVPGLRVKRLLPDARLWAVDCSDEMLESCAAIGCYERYLRAEAAKMPIPAGHMDFAISVHAFHLFEDKAAALVEMARATKDGGAVLLVTNVPDDLNAQLFHQMMPRFSELEMWRHFDEEDVARWALQAGLRLVEIVRAEYSVAFQGREALVEFLASRPFFGLRLLPDQEFAADLAYCQRQVGRMDEGELQSCSALTTFVLEKMPV
jgi:SAM-dependent methyltransferase